MMNQENPRILMNHFRQFRFLAALTALFCMLFMQLAVASCACPNTRMAPDGASAALSQMSGCMDMDMDMAQPGLCHAQDQAGKQSLDKAELPQVQPFVAAVLMPASIFIDATYPPLPVQAQASLLTRAPAPPLSIRNCCFRI